MLVENSIEIALKYGLEYLSEDIKSNKEFALRFLNIATESPLDKIKPFELNSFSEKLKDDPDIVNSYFDFICREVSKKEEEKEELKKKRSSVIYEFPVFVLGGRLMWDAKTSCLKFASLKLRDNKEFVIPILTRIGRDIQYVSDRLKDDEDVVLASLSTKQDFEAIHSDIHSYIDQWYYFYDKRFSYASNRIKSSKEFFLTHLFHAPPCFRYASNEIKSDVLFIKQIIKETSSFEVLEYVRCPYDFSKDIEFSNLYLLKKEEYLEDLYPRSFESGGIGLPFVFRDDKEVVLETVKRMGSELGRASDRLRDDLEVVCVACNEWGNSIEYASERIIKNPELLKHTKYSKEILFKKLNTWVSIASSSWITSKDLYIIQSKGIGTIKIGVAQDCNARLKQLQTANPYELKLVHVFKGMGHLEKYLHKELVDYRQQGEWFSYDCKEHIPRVLLNLMPEGALDHWWKN